MGEACREGRRAQHDNTHDNAVGWQPGHAPRTLRGKEEPHGRQDTKATTEAEEAEDADGRNPLNPAPGDVRRGRSVGRAAGSGQEPAAPVLPGAWSGVPAAQPGQLSEPGSNVGISSCQRPWTG